MAAAISGNIVLGGAYHAGAQYGEGHGVSVTMSLPRHGQTLTKTCPNRACGDLGVSLAINGKTFAVVGSSNDSGAAWVYGAVTIVVGETAITVTAEIV